jgi:hypothetical protein
MVAEKQEQKSYQHALRVIGQYLDREPSYRLSISEESDGFAVRSHMTPRRADEKVSHFDWTRLNDLNLWNTGKRDMPPRPTIHAGLWDTFPDGHEVFLRKLGAILDEEQASNVTVNETQEGLDVSYTLATGENKRKLYAPGDLS